MTILAALLFTFLSRLAYYLAFPFKNLDTDAVNHLMLVQAIRRNNNRVPDKLEKFILDTNDYPNGFHRVMALLPFSLSLYEKFGGLVPILMDTATLGLFAGIITATGGHEYGWLLLYPLIRLLWGYRQLPESVILPALVELLPDHIGFPGKHLENYVAQYKIEYIVLHKKYYAQLGKKRLNRQPYYDFSPYELQYDTPFFQCYKVIR